MRAQLHVHGDLARGLGFATLAPMPARQPTSKGPTRPSVLSPTDRAPARAPSLVRRRALALIAAAALSVACGSDEPVAPEPAAPVDAPAFAAPHASAPTDVGAACVDCHADIVAAYSGSGMARAMGLPTAAELDGLTQLAPAASPAGVAYGIYRTPDGAAYTVGETSASDPAHALGAQLVRAIGAGIRDRSFAVRHGQGLAFAPVEVLTDREAGGTRTLALAPGETIEPGTRFDFALTGECLGCHTSAPLPERYPMHHFAPHELPTTGVDCAGCHGTAAELDAHVAFQSDVRATGGDPLLRVGELPRNARMSICAACHLQGDARIVLRDDSLGRLAIGADVTAERATFVARMPSTDVGFVSQTERLVLSACYTASDMDCTTCHDPHQPLQRADGVRTRAQELARRACLDCHAVEACVRPADMPLPSHALGDEALDCVTCHMPRTPVFDVDHVTIHDHFVRRTPESGVRVVERGPLRFPESPDGDWKRFHWPDQATPSKGDALGLWMMALTAIGERAAAAELVDAPPGTEATELAMYHHVRGTLLESLGRPEDARDAYRAALDRDPDLGPAATNLGLLLGQLGAPVAGVEMLDGLLASAPTAEGALRNRALLRRQLGDFAGFRADLERAYAIAPSADLARALAASFARDEPQAHPQKAAQFARDAEALDPAPSAGPGSTRGDR